MPVASLQVTRLRGLLHQALPGLLVQPVLTFPLQVSSGTIFIIFQCLSWWKINFDMKKILLV